MVVAELDVVRIAVERAEADAPLIVDRDGMLAFAVSFERMEPIPRRYTQVGNLTRGMNGVELPESPPRYVGGHFLGRACSRQLLRLPVGKALDHLKM
jgi:hypothetical protein